MREIFSSVVFCLIFSFYPLSLQGEKVTKDSLEGVFYVSSLYGHIYQLPSIHSMALTTVACGHPVKVYSMKEKNRDKRDWRKVKTVGLQGYMELKSLKTQKIICLQNQYPKFFNSLDLTASEMYYLGRLPSLYVEGRSKVRIP